jgi:hypothetical protein
LHFPYCPSLSGSNNAAAAMLMAIVVIQPNVLLTRRHNSLSSDICISTFLYGGEHAWHKKHPRAQRPEIRTYFKILYAGGDFTDALSK